MPSGPAITDFPVGAQRYLQEKYGLPSYAPSYLNALVRLGKFPRPHALTAKRRVSALADFDRHAEVILAQAGLGTEPRASGKPPVKRGNNDPAQTDLETFLAASPAPDVERPR